MVARCTKGVWGGYRMVARYAEGDMAWLLGVQRVYRGHAEGVWSMEWLLATIDLVSNNWEFEV